MLDALSMIPITPNEDGTPFNPFLKETQLGTNVTIFHGNLPDYHCSRLIIVNTVTGERLSIDINNSKSMTDLPWPSEDCKAAYKVEGYFNGASGILGYYNEWKKACEVRWHVVRFGGDADIKDNE